VLESLHAADALRIALKEGDIPGLPFNTFSMNNMFPGMIRMGRFPMEIDIHTGPTAPTVWFDKGRLVCTAAITIDFNIVYPSQRVNVVKFATRISKTLTIKIVGQKLIAKFNDLSINRLKVTHSKVGIIVGHQAVNFALKRLMPMVTKLINKILLKKAPSLDDIPYVKLPGLQLVVGADHLWAATDLKLDIDLKSKLQDLVR